MTAIRMSWICIFNLKTIVLHALHQRFSLVYFEFHFAVILAWSVISTGTLECCKQYGRFIPYWHHVCAEFVGSLANDLPEPLAKANRGGRSTHDLVISCISDDAIAWGFYGMCLSIYIRRYLRLGPHDFLFRDCYSLVVFSWEILWKTSVCLSSLFPLEIKGSLSVPHIIILNTGVSLIFKLDQGLQVCVIPQIKALIVFKVSWVDTTIRQGITTLNPVAMMPQNCIIFSLVT